MTDNTTCDNEICVLKRECERYLRWKTLGEKPIKRGGGTHHHGCKRHIPNREKFHDTTYLRDLKVGEKFKVIMKDTNTGLKEEFKGTVTKCLTDEVIETELELYGKTVFLNNTEIIRWGK